MIATCHSFLFLFLKNNSDDELICGSWDRLVREAVKGMFGILITFAI